MNTSTPSKLSPKLIAVDCDGTLFDTNGLPSGRTVDAVKRLVSAGHDIVAVTGRSRFTAVDRLKAVPGIEHIVCSNGAYAWDVRASTLSWETKLPIAQVIEIVSRLRSAFTDVAFNWEAHDGFGWETSFAELAGGIDQMELGGKAEPVGSQALYKLKVRRPNVSTGLLQSQLLSVLGNSLCEITTSGAPFLELSAISADKGTGLQKTATQLGFTAADTIAFGDNQNDLPMFQWAGTSVAMGNALPENKRLADAVTLSNAEHGVAYYLDNLMQAGKL